LSTHAVSKVDFKRMPDRNENPVTASSAAKILGGEKPLSRGYMSAIKRAMGITARYLYVSDIRRFLANNPDFRMTDIYARDGGQRYVFEIKETPAGFIFHGRHFSITAQAPTVDELIDQIRPILSERIQRTMRRRRQTSRQSVTVGTPGELSC
jgi:hypothetical protein